MKLPKGKTLKSSTYVIDRYLRTTECADIYFGCIISTGQNVIIHRLLDSYGGYAELFMEKARIMTRAPHESIAEVKDVFAEDESAYYVTVATEGPSLAELTEGTPLSPERAAEIVKNLAHGTASFHDNGVPNLAISPENIIIDNRSGKPVLSEFSLPLPLFMDETERDPYSAPERYGATGRNTPSHDVYSLGAILYRCVTGHTPPASSLIETEGLEYASNVPDALADIIDTAMEPRMLNRYFSAGEMLEALEQEGSGRTSMLSYYGESDTEISHAAATVVSEPERDVRTLPMPEVVNTPKPTLKPEPQPEPELAPAPEPTAAVVEEVKTNHDTPSNREVIKPSIVPVAEPEIKDPEPSQPEPIKEPLPEQAPEINQVTAPEPDSESTPTQKPDEILEAETPEAESPAAECPTEEIIEQEPVSPAPKVTAMPRHEVTAEESSTEKAPVSGNKRVVLSIVGLVVVGIVIGVIYMLQPSTENPAPIPPGPVILDDENHEVTDSMLTVGTTKFSYTGTLNADGLPTGEGTANYKGQWKQYVGNWENGLWQGHGKLTFSNGDYYEGEFDENFFTTGKYFIDPTGSGKDAGSYFEGVFQNGAPYNGAWKTKAGTEFQKVTDGKTVMI